MPINKPLLRKVKKHILEEPRRYDQSTFGKRVRKSVAPCGTVACLAGWADFLANGTDLRLAGQTFHPSDDVESRARCALGLSELQAIKLFSADPSDPVMGIFRWPEPFATDYGKARSKKAKAEVAARYIDYIIKTGKVT